MIYRRIKKDRKMVYVPIRTKPVKVNGKTIQVLTDVRADKAQGNL